MGGCPPARPGRQQPPYRCYPFVLFGERPHPARSVRAQPAAFVPPQPHRPTKRRQIHQIHHCFAFGPHQAVAVRTQRLPGLGTNTHPQRPFAGSFTPAPQPRQAPPAAHTWYRISFQGVLRDGFYTRLWKTPTPTRRISLPAHIRRARLITTGIAVLRHGVPSSSSGLWLVGQSADYEGSHLVAPYRVVGAVGKWISRTSPCHIGGQQAFHCTRVPRVGGFCERSLWGYLSNARAIHTAISRVSGSLGRKLPSESALTIPSSTKRSTQIPRACGNV